ncbi:O-antigen ligase family protein [Marinobacter sp.]|uniref:O-antigen ligase family protein n=1 Tax=Marinobacter sp. TaxID=50741 RepID=UPI003A8CF5F5
MAPFWGIGILFSVGLGLSLFGSLFSFVDGAYAAQRFYLCVLLVLFSAIGLASSLNSRSKGLILVWPGVCLLFVCFNLLIHGASSVSPFRWVEPLLYAFFILAVTLGGCWLARLGGLVAQIRLLVAVKVVFLMLYAGMALNYYWFSLLDDGSAHSDILPWGFVNIRYWSHLATWLLPLLPLALIILPYSRNTLWRSMVLVTGGLWVWMLILSSARGAMLSVFLGACLSVVIFRRSSKEWVKCFLLIWCLGVLFWLVLSVTVPSLQGEGVIMRELTWGSSGRGPLWVEAFAMSQQNFPFGMGAQSWLTHEVLSAEYQSAKKFAHPHNMYLMWAAEYGWITVFSFVLLGYLGVKRVIEAKVSFRERVMPSLPVIALAYTASVLGALVHAAFSAVFIAPASLIIAVFVLAYFIAVTWPETPARNIKIAVRLSRPAKAFILILYFLLAGGWLVQVLQYYEAMILDSVMYLDQSKEGFFPRFWYHGGYPRHDSL